MRLARDLSVLQAIHPGLMADDKPLAELDKLADEPADRRELLAFALRLPAPRRVIRRRP